MTTYYIATNGNNANNGSQQYPWRTISYALGSSSPTASGDTVYVRSGTYNEQILIEKSGITLSSYSSEAVTIDGTGVSVVFRNNGWGDGLIHISGKNNITVKNMNIVNSGSCGFFISNSNNITISRNYIYNTKSSAIKTSSCEYINIEKNDCSHNNMIEGTGNVQEIISLSNTSNSTIQYNTVHDGNKASCCGGEGILTKDGSSYVNIHHNEVYRVVAVGIYIGEVSGNSHHIYAYNNKVHDIGFTYDGKSRWGHGIDIGSEYTGGIDTVHVYNNIIYNCRLDGIHVPSAQASNTIKNIFIFNNTVYNNGLSTTDTMGGIGIQKYTTYPNIQNIVVINNLCFNNKNYQIAGTSTNITGLVIDHNLLYPYKSSDMNGTNYISNNPMLSNATNYDFHLTGSSPAINAGARTAFIPAQFYDYDGNLRGNEIDIGAYEYVQACSSPLINLTTN